MLKPSHLDLQSRLMEITGDQWITPRIVLLRAPAGYGKTGTIAAWLGERDEAASSTRWVHCAPGLGDAFWGAFLARLLRGGVTRRADFTQALLREAMVFGNVAGRLCVREKGAIESLPTWEQILSMKEELGL